MEVKVNELSKKDKKELDKMMPNLSLYKLKSCIVNLLDKMDFKLIRKGDYQLMKKMVDRTDNYIENIRCLNKEVENLSISIDNVLDSLNIKEEQRRKNACKIGGLQASLNTQKFKNECLVKDNINLIAKIEDNKQELDKVKKEFEDTIKFKDAEIKMLRNKGKKNKNVEDYKNYFQCRKELEKRNGE